MGDAINSAPADTSRTVAESASSTSKPTRMYLLTSRPTSSWCWMQEEKGATMVEYSLLVVLIAIVALIAVQLAGSEVSETFSEIGSSLD